MRTNKAGKRGRYQKFQLKIGKFNIPVIFGRTLACESSFTKAIIQMQKSLSWFILSFIVLADIGICYETFPTDIAIHLSGRYCRVFRTDQKFMANGRATLTKEMQSYYAVDNTPQNFGIACLRSATDIYIRWYSFPGNETQCCYFCECGKVMTKFWTFDWGNFSDVFHDSKA